MPEIFLLRADCFAHNQLSFFFWRVNSCLAPLRLRSRTGSPLPCRFVRKTRIHHARSRMEISALLLCDCGHGWVRNSTEKYGGVAHGILRAMCLGNSGAHGCVTESPKVRFPPVSHVQCDTVKCTEARERSYSRLHGSGTMPPQNTNSPRQMPDGCQCLAPLRLRRAGIARCRYCWQRNRTYRSYRTYKTGALLEQGAFKTQEYMALTQKNKACKSCFLQFSCTVIPVSFWSFLSFLSFTLLTLWLCARC